MYKEVLEMRSDSAHGRRVWLRGGKGESGGLGQTPGKVEELEVRKPESGHNRREEGQEKKAAGQSGKDQRKRCGGGRENRKDIRGISPGRELKSSRAQGLF